MGNAVPKVAYAPNSGNGSLVSRVFGTGALLLSGLIASASSIDPGTVDKTATKEVNQPNTTLVSKDSNSRDVFEVLFGGFTEAEQHSNPYTDGLRNCKSMGEGQAYLNNALRELNPQLLPVLNHSTTTTALNDFNRRNRTSFFCMGIKGDSGEFVFLDNNYFLGRTNIPRRIALSYDEVMKTQGKQNVMNLLQEKLRTHVQEMSTQHSIWSVPYRFDFPRNQGASMMVLEQYPLPGMESDLLSSFRMYTENYGMSSNPIPVGQFHKENLNNLLKSNKITNFPKIVSSTKESILTNLESSLRKAIDDGKTYFVFHYFLHGSPDGTIWTDGNPIRPEEIAEILTRPHGAEKKPISEQIDIFMWAASCYSGKQLDRMRTYFNERRDIPVRNLRIITEALDTSSAAATNPQNASLVSFIPIMADNSGTTDYYSSMYDEYMNHLQNSGIRVNDQGRSYLWKVRFIDLMSYYDSPFQQDLQGFHYSNDPKTKKVIEHQFSKLEPKISENPDSQSLYAQLENLEENGVT